MNLESKNAVVDHEKQVLSLSAPPCSEWQAEIDEGDRSVKAKGQIYPACRCLVPRCKEFSWANAYEITKIMKSVVVHGKCFIFAKKLSGLPRAPYEGKNVILGRLFYRLFIGDLSDLDKIGRHCGDSRCLNPKHMYKIERRKSDSQLPIAKRLEAVGKGDLANRNKKYKSVRIVTRPTES